MKIDRQPIKEFLEESKKSKNFRDMGDAVGLPTQEDKDRIRRMLLKYERRYPGYIAKARDEAKKQYAVEGGQKQKFGLVNKGASGRMLFEIPEELFHWINKAYPLMFQNKKHLHWFIKNFNELLIPEKY